MEVLTRTADLATLLIVLPQHLSASGQVGTCIPCRCLADLLLQHLSPKSPVNARIQVFLLLLQGVGGGGVVLSHVVLSASNGEHTAPLC